MSLGNKGVYAELKHKKIDGLLLWAVIFGMFFLLFFQAVMLNESIRTLLSYATSLEGRPLPKNDVFVGEGNIYITLKDERPHSKARLLLNGEPIANLNARYMRVSVRDNDVLEIDASKSGDETVYVYVADVSSNVVTPVVGHETKAKNGIELISRVKIK